MELFVKFTNAEDQKVTTKTQQSSGKQQLSPQEQCLAPSTCVTPILENESEADNFKIQFYLIDYNSFTRKYQLIQTSEEGSNFFYRQLTDLLLATIKFHTRQIPCKSSLQQKASRMQRILKPIIIPVYDGKQYAFIFEMDQYRYSINEIEISDRFLVFIANRLLYQTISEYVKAIVKLEYEDKSKLIKKGEKYNFQSLNLRNRKELLENIDNYIKYAQRFYWSNNMNYEEEENEQIKYYLKSVAEYNILIRLNTLHYRPILLLSLLIFYTIREYKIILFGYKENRHIMSETAIALKQSFCPMEYCYPIIFSVVSEKNLDYMDSPVPCLICYWGDQNSQARLRDRYKRIGEDKIMPSILIDLNALVAYNIVKDTEQSQNLVQLNQFLLKKKNDGPKPLQTISDRARCYLFEKLPISENRQSQVFRNSLAFQICKQSNIL